MKRREKLAAYGSARSKGSSKGKDKQDDVIEEESGDSSDEGNIKKAKTAGGMGGKAVSDLLYLQKSNAKKEEQAFSSNNTNQENSNFGSVPRQSTNVGR